MRPRSPAASAPVLYLLDDAPEAFIYPYANPCRNGLILLLIASTFGCDTSQLLLSNPLSATRSIQRCSVLSVVLGGEASSTSSERITPASIRLSRRILPDSTRHGRVCVSRRPEVEHQQELQNALRSWLHVGCISQRARFAPSLFSPKRNQRRVRWRKSSSIRRRNRGNVPIILLLLRAHLRFYLFARVIFFAKLNV